MIDFACLFLGPRVDIVGAELFIDPLYAAAPFADMHAGKHFGVKDGGKRGMFAQPCFDIHFERFARTPSGAQAIRRQRNGRSQLGEKYSLMGCSSAIRSAKTPG